jgi:lysophospholipase L1-like esterase
MEGNGEAASIGSFVAVGDSFTEGLDDTYPDGSFRGWADRVAQRLAADRPDFRYANLAVRGRLLDRVVAEQVPRAVELRPDLVSFSAGGNDLLRPGCDPDRLAAGIDAAVERLRACGARVLLFTGLDAKRLPVLRGIGGRVTRYNLHMYDIARRRGCSLVDLWTMTVLLDPRALSVDRLPLSAEGHRRVALRVCEVLGLPVEADWREPFAPLPAVAWRVKRQEDMRWVREHLAPWVARRVHGRSSGDEVVAKRPDLHPL